MNIENITTKLVPIKNLLIRYKVVVFITFIVVLFGYVTMSISHFSNAEPTAQQIDDKKLSIKIVKLDEKSIEKIKELQDKNISIESLFNNGRENPFQ